jgi:hypothetical protein
MRVTAKIRDRGTTPRGMRRAYGHASKAAWLATAAHFHAHYRQRRFTQAHARAAGYGHRKGELLARGTKAFRNSYTGRKLRLFGHTDPLRFSGVTYEKMRVANISSTRNMGKVAYRGASKFNFQHPRSRIRMSEEFKRILPYEADELGEYYDGQLDIELKKLDK